MRAIVLAGGKGSRLGAVCKYLPKPLVPVGDMAVGEILVRQLKAAGCDHITFAVGHGAQLIMSFFDSLDFCGVKVDYSREEQPLGTIGPLKLIDDLPEDFIVCNGDVLTDLDIREMYNLHLAGGGMATVGAYRREVVDEFGVMSLDGNLIEHFTEKPRRLYWVSMGVYVLSRDALKYVPDEQPYGFDDLMGAMIADKAHVRARMFDGYWLDIGRPDDYERANREFEAVKDRLLPSLRGR